MDISLDFQKLYLNVEETVSIEFEPLNIEDYQKVLAFVSQSGIGDDEIKNLATMAKDEIVNDLKKNPAFTYDVLQQMAHDLKEADDIIVNMAQKSVRHRMAEVLVNIHKSFGTNPDGTLSVLLSREDFASLVGTATESAIRVLSQFKKEGLISTIGKHIKIENLDELNRVE